MNNKLFKIAFITIINNNAKLHNILLAVINDKAKP